MGISDDSAILAHGCGDWQEVSDNGEVTFKRYDQGYFLENLSDNILGESEIQGRDSYNNLGKKRYRG